MPKKSRTWPLPVPTWTCPFCSYVHKPADLLRLDNDTLKCRQCRTAFPDKPDKKAALTTLRLSFALQFKGPLVALRCPRTQHYQKFRVSGYRAEARSVDKLMLAILPRPAIMPLR